MKPRFTSRRYESGDEVAINDLYRRVAGRDRSLERWRWQWMENPAGPSEMWVIELEDDGGRTIVGHHGIMPFRARAGNREVMLGKTENTMVLPEVRHRLLYPRFERRFLEAYRERFDALFSTRGPAAAIRLRKAMGYRPTEPLLLVSIGRRMRSSLGALRRRLSGPIPGPPPPRIGACGPGTTTMLDDPGFLAGWHDASTRRRVPEDALGLVKDDDAVSWRYRRHPSGAHRGLLLDDAVAIVHRQDRDTIRIDELAIRGDREQGLPRAWRDLWKAATSVGATRLLTLATASQLPDSSMLRAAGLIRWRTHPRVPAEADAMPVRLQPRDGRALPDVRAWRIGEFVSEGPWLPVGATEPSGGPA